MTHLKKKSAKLRSRKRATVQRFSSRHPLARDEGPRLIPLDPAKPQAFQYYLDLADAAMGQKKKQP